MTSRFLKMLRGVLLIFSALAHSAAAQDKISYPDHSCILPQTERVDDDTWEKYDACLLDYIDRAGSDKEKIIHEVEKMVYGYVAPLVISPGNADWLSYPSFVDTCVVITEEAVSGNQESADTCRSEYIKQADKTVHDIDRRVE